MKIDYVVISVSLSVLFLFSKRCLRNLKQMRDICHTLQRIIILQPLTVIRMVCQSYVLLSYRTFLLYFTQ